jgi:hypothetical protein
MDHRVATRVRASHTTSGIISSNPLHETRGRQRTKERRQSWAEAALESPLAHVMKKHGLMTSNPRRHVIWGTMVDRLGSTTRNPSRRVISEGKADRLTRLVAPVLVIGQQKAGTTLLYTILCQLLGMENSRRGRLKELNLFGFPLSCMSSPNGCSDHLAPYLRPASLVSGRRPVRIFIDVRQPVSIPRPLDCRLACIPCLSC